MCEPPSSHCRSPGFCPHPHVVSFNYKSTIGRVDPETGDIIPTDGRNRKKNEKTEETSEQDYKKLYEKLLCKYEAQKALVTSLKKQLRELQEKG